MDSPRTRVDVILCPDCDLLLEAITLEAGTKIVCPRCHATLRTSVTNTVEKTMALSLTGLVLFIPAMFLPLLSFDVVGLESSGDIISSSLAMIRTGFIFTGIAVLLTSVLIPLAKLLILFTVSLQVHLQKSNRKTAIAFRLYTHLDEWGMLEVYMIGILVTIIKMMHMAKINYDAGFYCFVGLLLVTLTSSLFLDEPHFWEKIYIQSREQEEKDNFQALAGEGVKSEQEANWEIT